MQYKYQEVSYNFLPNLGTDYLSGMVKLTAFSPLTNCKKYTIIIVFRDATRVSCFFPNQQEFSYLICTVSNSTASTVQKSKPAYHLPILQLPI